MSPKEGFMGQVPLGSPTGDHRVDRTALSYWFPLIDAAGLPVPRTLITKMPVPAQQCIWAGFDGKDGDDPKALGAFIAQLKDLADRVGYPCFLRTDHTSGKHEWEHTCFVKSADRIGRHVFSIAEHSEICDMIGLPWDTWVVREYLPIIPHGVCPSYGNMPLCREFRFFVVDGEVKCWHPYWPAGAIEQGGADESLFDVLSHLADVEYSQLHRLAQKAARAVDGAWSVDILETERGWHVTDMAEAHKSFHWEGCTSFVSQIQPR
jgi:hypothetical protein